MRRILFYVLIPAILLSACSKEQAVPELTAAQRKQKVDSIMTIRNAEVEVAARMDLQLRSKIEVKVKADSIITARSSGVKRDTSKAGKRTFPSTARPFNH